MWTSVIVSLLAGCDNSAETDVEEAAARAVAAVEEAPAPAEDGSMLPARGDDSGRKSKNGHLKTKLGTVDVEVKYGRPNVRGREVWGNLVPLGKVWRTGADEATTVYFSDDVLVAGERLAAGKYTLFTEKAAEGDAWQVIFNSELEQWGAYDYDPSADVLRVETKQQESPMTETLTFEKTSTGLLLKWEKVAVPIEITTAPAAVDAVEGAEGADDAEAAPAEEDHD